MTGMEKKKKTTEQDISQKARLTVSWSK